MSIRDPSDPSPHRRRAKPRTPPAPFGFETADSRAEGGGADERDLQDGRADEPRGYRVRSEEVWQAARAEYMAGHAAEAVCAQFDLGLSAFRQRARREGWRRSDAEAEPPEPLGFPPEPEAVPPPPSWPTSPGARRRRRSGVGGSMRRGPGCASPMNCGRRCDPKRSTRVTLSA